MSSKLGAFRTPFVLQFDSLYPLSKNGCGLLIKEAEAANTNSSIASMSTEPSGVLVILSTTPSVLILEFCLKSSIALNTSGSATSPSIYNIAGSPSSENLSVTIPTPKAKSDSSSKKSSTWKSPSSCTIPHAAGSAKIRQIHPMIIGRLPVPDLIAIFCNLSLLTK